MHYSMSNAGCHSLISNWGMWQKLFLHELAFCESNNGLFKLLVKQQVFSSFILACCPTIWWANHTLLTGNNSSALSCTVVALRDVEHFGDNSHATSTHLQMYSWKSINGAYYVGQQQNVILLISCCGHRLAQEARHKQSIWSRDCLFFHITQTVGTRNQCNSEHGLIQYASSAFSNAPACFPALCAWQTSLQQVGNRLITVVVMLKGPLAFWRRWKQMYGYKCRRERDGCVGWCACVWQTTGTAQFNAPWKW